jgi:acyl carrier protein
MDEQRLKKVVSNILDIQVSEINDQSSMKTVTTWDSLRHIQLIAAIEDEFQITFSMEDMTTMINYPMISQKVSELTGKIS